MNYKPYHNDETRTSVLLGVRTPDNQAGWARFFDLYAGFVYAIARGKGLSPTDADEIVQSVFLDLVQGKIAEFDRAKGRFRTWLSKLATWRTLDFLRRKSVRDFVHPADPVLFDTLVDAAATDLERTLDAEWEGMVTQESLRRLRAEVSETHFAVYQASVLEGLDTDAIRRLYGVSRDNLYQIRKRVGARYRDILQAVAKELDEPDIHKIR